MSTEKRRKIYKDEAHKIINDLCKQHEESVNAEKETYQHEIERIKNELRVIQEKNGKDNDKEAEHQKRLVDIEAEHQKQIEDIHANYRGREDEFRQREAQMRSQRQELLDTKNPVLIHLKRLPVAVTATIDRKLSAAQQWPSTRHKANSKLPESEDASALGWNFCGNELKIGTHTFQFDRIYGPEERNEQVFTEVASMVDAAKEDGKHAVFMAYGESGSGKSTTMIEGFQPKKLGDPPADASLLDRAMQRLFSRPGWKVKATCVEVYAGKIYDLVPDKSREERELKHGRFRTERNVAVPGYLRYQVSRVKLEPTELNCKDDVVSFIRSANKKRVTGKAGNKASSRGHAWYALELVYKDEPRGMVTLVDLAGLEKRPETQDKHAVREWQQLYDGLEQLKHAFRYIVEAKWAQKTKGRPQPDSGVWATKHKLLETMEDAFIGRNAYQLPYGRYGLPYLLVIGHIHDHVDHEEVSRAVVDMLQTWRKLDDATCVIMRDSYQQLKDAYNKLVRENQQLREQLEKGDRTKSSQ